MKEFIITTGIINRDFTLECYFNEITKLQMITAADEAELARRIRLGDQQALDKLVTSNLRFVVSVAKQYQNQGLAIGDLVNEGNIGLITAAKLFDENKGCKFISYAVWWIRQAIIFAIAEQRRVVRIPFHQVRLIRKITKTVQEFEQRHAYQPSPEQLSENLDIPAEKIADTLLCTGRDVPLDSPITAGEELTMLDIIPYEDVDIYQSHNMELLKKVIVKALGILKKRERFVIELYFGLTTPFKLSLEDIAEKLDLSPEQTRRIKNSGLKRLRESSAARLLQSCLN